MTMIFLRTLVVVCLAQIASASEPLVVAHRGLLRHAPENTLANFRACLELRLGFEFDVQKTKDGRLVCIHDDTLDRTTNGTGKVSDLTLDEIRRLDAGTWFDPKFSGTKVPTIDEVLKLVSEYRQHDLLIAVDVKSEGVEQDVVRIAEKYDVLHRLLFIGRTISEPQVRSALKKASSQVQTAVVTNNVEEFSEALAAPNSDWVYFRYLPPKEQMEAVRSEGKRAFIAGATVAGNVPKNWEQVIDLRLDGILTDYPLELAATLRKEKLQ